MIYSTFGHYSPNAIRPIYRTYSIWRIIIENDETSFAHYASFAAITAGNAFALIKCLFIYF